MSDDKAIKRLGSDSHLWNSEREISKHCAEADYIVWRSVKGSVDQKLGRLDDQKLGRLENVVHIGVFQQQHSIGP